jgi:hypothetical protein
MRHEFFFPCTITRQRRPFIVSRFGLFPQV